MCETIKIALGYGSALGLAATLFYIIFSMREDYKNLTPQKKKMEISEEAERNLSWFPINEN